MRFTTRSGVTLSYDLAGEGAPLCLINGYRLSGLAWPDLFIERLAEHFTVIRFDNRGTGRSDKPASGYDFSTQSQDVVALLDHLGLRQAHMLGFSMGGAIAQEVAIQYPDRVDRLVLFGTFCAGSRAEPPSYTVFRRLMPTPGQTPEDAARQAWPVTYSPDFLAANAGIVERQMHRELEFPTPSFVAERQMEAIKQSDRYRDLPRIAAPTLVATGAHDLLVKPRNSSILASQIPNARLELLDGLGHRAIWEAPEEIAELVADFLGKIPERSGPNRHGLSAAHKPQEDALTPNASPVLGTWKLKSYEREEIATGHRHNQFGEHPDGYLGYAPDGRMYAMFIRQDRITPRDVVLTDEEGVQLIGSIVAYAGTYTLGEKQVIHHIDISWNQGWTGTDQVRFFDLDGDTLTITTAPYRSHQDGKEGRSILVWDRVPPR